MGGGVGIIVVATGVLLRFATATHSSTFGIHGIGVILMVLGAVAFAISAWDFTLGNPSLRSGAKHAASLQGRRRHHSNMYVFALPARGEARTDDPRDVSQWRFFVVPSWRIDRRDRKRISAPMLSSMAKEVRYSELPDAIRRAAELENGGQDDGR